MARLIAPPRGHGVATARDASMSTLAWMAAVSTLRCLRTSATPFINHPRTGRSSCVATACRRTFGPASLGDHRCRPSVEGPDFSLALERWAYQHGGKLELIRPGKPTQNAHDPWPGPRPSRPGPGGSASKRAECLGRDRGTGRAERAPCRYFRRHVQGSSVTETRAPPMVRPWFTGKPTALASAGFDAG